MLPSGVFQDKKSGLYFSLAVDKSGSTSSQSFSPQVHQAGGQHPNKRKLLGFRSGGIQKHDARCLQVQYFLSELQDILEEAVLPQHPGDKQEGGMWCHLDNHRTDKLVTETCQVLSVFPLLVARTGGV